MSPRHPKRYANKIEAPLLTDHLQRAELVAPIQNTVTHAFDITMEICLELFMDTHIRIYLSMVNLKPYVWIRLYVHTYIHVLTPIHVSTHSHIHIAKSV